MTKVSRWAGQLATAGQLQTILTQRSYSHDCCDEVTLH